MILETISFQSSKGKSVLLVLRPLVFLLTFTFNSLNARKTFSIVPAVSYLIVNNVYSNSQNKIVVILSYV